MKFRTIFVYLHFFVAVLLISMVIVGYFSEDIVGVYKIALCVLFSIFSAFFIIFVLLPDFRVIELTEEGCSVNIFKVKKTHAWKDIVYICRDTVSTKTNSFEGIFFSTKLCRKSGKKITASYIQHSLDIFNCFCIFWMDEKEKEKVLNQLKEWGVEVITSPKLAEKEAYEQKLAEKINLREQRKKLYKKRNK